MFQGQAGQTYDIDVELGTLRDSVMTIYDSSGQQIERNDEDGGSHASRLIWTCPADGAFTVSVHAYCGYSGDPCMEELGACMQDRTCDGILGMSTDDEPDFDACTANRICGAVLQCFDSNDYDPCREEFEACMADRRCNQILESEEPDMATCETNRLCGAIMQCDEGTGRQDACPPS